MKILPSQADKIEIGWKRQLRKILEKDINEAIEKKDCAFKNGHNIESARYAGRASAFIEVIQTLGTL